MNVSMSDDCDHLEVGPWRMADIVAITFCHYLQDAVYRSAGHNSGWLNIEVQVGGTGGVMSIDLWGTEITLDHSEARDLVKRLAEYLGDSAAARDAEMAGHWEMPTN